MFEEVELYKVKYSPEPVANSLRGVKLDSDVLTTTDSLSYSEAFLKDCRYVLDGTSYVCQFFPVSSFAKEHLMYIQSFSYWKARKEYFTRRKGLDSYLLSYTYSGVGNLCYRGKNYKLQKGDIFLIDCREEHEYHAQEENWEHCILHFSGAPMLPVYEEFLRESDICFHLEPEANSHQKLVKLLTAYNSIEPYREHQVSALLTDFVLTVLTSNAAYKKARESMPTQVRDVVRYLNEHLTSEIVLDDLAEKFSISKYHLCRSFKRYIGFTPNEYVTQLRIERAKDLLKTTALSANQIGTIVGIADENYFYRLFKKHVGMSPQKYRKA